VKAYVLRLLNFDANISLFFVGHNDDHKSEAQLSAFRIVGGEPAIPGELPFQVSHINAKLLRR